MERKYQKSEKIEKISKLFQGSSSNYIFETELTSTNIEVDFSICILKNELSYLLKHWRKEELQATIQKDKIWEKLFQFCSEWKNSKSPLNHHVSDVWFEFDNHQIIKDLPQPCFFFSPRTLYRHDRNIKREYIVSRHPSSSLRNIDWLFNSALTILFKKYVSDKLKKNVKTCIEKLPRNGAVFQIGVMMARNLDRLRICTSMPIDDYTIYLKAIGWNGSYDHLYYLLQTLKTYVDVVFIDIDVGERIFPKIGFECCYREDNNVKPRLKKFMNYLMEKHLCIKQKAEIILSWINNDDNHSNDICRGNRTKRTLSHIKIVQDSDNSLKAKAYLSLSVLLKS
jgi:hypothetical protein